MHWTQLSLSLALSLSPSLHFCLPQSHLPSMPESLTVPMPPSYANRLSCYQQCMSVWWASLARLSVSCYTHPVSPSILPPVPRLSALLHLSDCMPTIVFQQYLCGRKHPSCWLLCQFSLYACSFDISLRHYVCFFMCQSWPSWQSVLLCYLSSSKIVHIIFRSIQKWFSPFTHKETHIFKEKMNEYE